MAVRLEEQLLVAISKEDIKLETVNDLLSKKPDVNYKNDSGQFPLLVAVQKGRKDIVQRLVNEGADVNMCGIHKITSLSLASERGYHDVVEILIEKGAKVDHRLEDDRTPLMIACQCGHVKTVEVLLSKKADVDLHYGLTEHNPIMIACQYGHAGVIEVILPYCVPHVVDVKNAEGYTLLAIGSMNNHVEVVDILLQKGAKVNFRCTNGFTALHLACVCGHTNVVEKLLKGGANIDLRDSNGNSALILATLNDHIGVVRVLVHYNAEVDLCLHTSRRTALMIACDNGSHNIVELLLNAEPQELSKIEMSEEDTPGRMRSRSADVNIQDDGGYTALSFACRSGRDDIVKTLLKHGASLNHDSNNCESPLLLATKKGYTNVVQVLLDNGACINPPLPVFNLEYRNRFPLPLIVATALDHTDIVELLIKHNAYVDVAFGKHQFVTSLILAIFSGNFEVVKTLVENGASIEYLSTEVWYSLNCLKFTCVDVANAMANQKILEFLQLKLTETKDKPKTPTESGQDVSTGDSGILATSALHALDFATDPLPKKMKTSICNGISPKMATTVSREVQSEFENIVYAVLKELQPVHSISTSSLSHNDQNLSEMLPKEVRPTLETVFNFASLSSSAVSKEPSINNTFRLLLPVASEWENIGILLNIKEGDLSSINADHKQVRNCLREVLKLWLKRVNPPPTWNDLAEAVESLGEAKLAAEIKEKYFRV